MLESFATDLHRCAVCHDQCLFATAEVFATGRQTLATSRKAMLLESVRRGELAWSPSMVDVVYAGLSSGVQHSVCVWRDDGGEWPDETLYVRAARAEIVRAGLAPVWAQRYRDRWCRSGNPYGLIDDAFPQGGKIVVFLDAATRAFEPQARGSWLQIGDRIAEDMVLLAGGSSGFELFDLGYVEEAAAAGTRLCEELARLGPTLIVCDAPEPVYMMTRIWPAWGIVPPAQVVPAATWLADVLLARGSRRTATSPLYTFHDPAYLVRYLKAMDSPRAVLGLLGVQIVEMLRHLEETPPSGSCYGEDVGHWVRSIAAERAASAQTTGATGIITNSPFDYRNLQGFGLPVMDLAEVAAQRLA